MQPHDHEPGNIIERNPDGTFTKETLARAIKALKKRLKVTRLDDESRLGHDAMYRQQDMAFEDALEMLRSQLSLTFSTEDILEGVSAFFEKRDPEWKGR